MEIIVTLWVLGFLFWLGFKLTGAMLSAFIWLAVKLPIALAVFTLGLLCCGTLILIPVGLKLFGTAGRILF